MDLQRWSCICLISLLYILHITEANSNHGQLYYTPGGFPMESEPRAYSPNRDLQRIFNPHFLRAHPSDDVYLACPPVLPFDPEANIQPRGRSSIANNTSKSSIISFPLNVRWYYQPRKNNRTLLLTSNIARDEVSTKESYSKVELSQTQSGSLWMYQVAEQSTGRYRCEYWPNDGNGTQRKAITYTLVVEENHDHDWSRAGDMWPNSTVRYTFDPTVTLLTRRHVEDAFQKIASISCIKFVLEDPPLLDTLIVEEHSPIPDPTSGMGDLVPNCDGSIACYSHFGDNRLVIGRDCARGLGMRHIYRQVLRVLCLEMELSRSDRDLFVSLKPDPGQSCVIPRFDTVAKKKAHLYDYFSVTHPHCGAPFSCFTPRLPAIKTCGSDKLSPLDVSRINEVYDCMKGCKTRYYKLNETLTRTDVPILSNDKDQPKTGICRRRKANGDLVVGTYSLENRTCSVQFDYEEDMISSVSRMLKNTSKSIPYPFKSIPDKFEVLLAIPGHRYDWTESDCSDPSMKTYLDGMTYDKTDLHSCRKTSSYKGYRVGTVIDNKCITPDDSLDDMGGRCQFIVCTREDVSKLQAPGVWSGSTLTLTISLTAVLLVLLIVVSIAALFLYFRTKLIIIRGSNNENDYSNTESGMDQCNVRQVSIHGSNESIDMSNRIRTDTPIPRPRRGKALPIPTEEGYEQMDCNGNPLNLHLNIPCPTTTVEQINKVNRPANSYRYVGQDHPPELAQTRSTSPSNLNQSVHSLNSNNFNYANSMNVQGATPPPLPLSPPPPLPLNASKMSKPPSRKLSTESYMSMRGYKQQTSTINEL